MLSLIQIQTLTVENLFQSFCLKFYLTIYFTQSINAPLDKMSGGAFLFTDTLIVVKMGSESSFHIYKN